MKTVVFYYHSHNYLIVVVAVVHAGAVVGGDPLPDTV
jgi:hypothetical protein